MGNKSGSRFLILNDEETRDNMESLTVTEDNAVKENVHGYITGNNK